MFPKVNNESFKMYETPFEDQITMISSFDMVWVSWSATFDSMGTDVS